MTAMLGLGVFFGSCILVEDDVLTRALGAESSQDCTRTKRLAP